MPTIIKGGVYYNTENLSEIDLKEVEKKDKLLFDLLKKYVKIDKSKAKSENSKL